MVELPHILHLRLDAVDQPWKWAVLGVCAGILILTTRIPYLDHTWRTTSAGLQYRGILRGGFIPWAEVRNIRVTSPYYLSGERIIIQGDGRKTAIPGHDTLLCASVRQHLRRVGKAEGIAVPKEADWLWRDLTVDLPDNIEWVDNGWFNLPLIWVGVILLLSPSVVQFIWFRHSNVNPIYMFMLVLGFHLHSWMRTSVKRVTLTKDTVEVDTRRSIITMRWDELQSVGWSEKAICLRREGKRAVCFNWVPGSADSTAVVLAIMQRMRNSSLGVQVPVSDQLQLLEIYRKLTEQTPEASL